MVRSPGDHVTSAARASTCGRSLGGAGSVRSTWRGGRRVADDAGGHRVEVRGGSLEKATRSRDRSITRAMGARVVSSTMPDGLVARGGGLRECASRTIPKWRGKMMTLTEDGVFARRHSSRVPRRKRVRRAPRAKSVSADRASLTCHPPTLSLPTSDYEQARRRRHLRQDGRLQRGPIRGPEFTRGWPEYGARSASAPTHWCRRQSRKMDTRGVHSRIRTRTPLGRMANEQTIKAP